MNPYGLLKSIHVSCVAISITGFVLRFALAWTGSPLLGTRVARIAPHLVDTVLLVSAIGLAVIAGVAPWRDAWLGAKVIGLVVYVVAGSFAIKRARSRGGRLASGVIAIAVYAYIVSVALAKSPWSG